MQRFDGGASGAFTKQKLRRVVRQLGIMVPAWQIETIIDKCSARGDEEVDFRAFVDVLFGEEDDGMF